MRTAIERIESGDDVDAALAWTQDELLRAGFDSVDYVQLADAESLAPLLHRSERPGRVLVAARIGGTRLIDNMPVDPG